MTLEESFSLQNIDLVLVGIAIAAIGILGFIVFFNNRKSVTNRLFLLFALVAILYSTFNYLSYQPAFNNIALWLLRVVIFFAVWHAFCIFQVLYVFPKEKTIFSKKYKFILIPFVVFVSILNLTPLVFSKIGGLSPDGRVNKIINGPAIFVFAAMILILTISCIVLLFKKIKRGTSLETAQTKLVFAGLLTTFALHIIFNFILPAFFDNPRFIPLVPVFIFPFVICTFYAIVRHHLLNIKIIATEILAFVLTVVSLIEILISEDIVILVFRVAVFMLVLTFSIFLIKSVMREVEQREQLEKLAKELRAVNERLKELDRLKSEFLSFASHQVKTPMAAVKGYAALVLDGTYGVISDKVKEAVGKIREAADRMIALVNNLLDMRRIEEGRMEYVFSVVDISKLVAEVVEELKPLALKKGLTLTFTSEAEVVNVSVDPQKLRQVIQNFIDNAIKYTDKGWAQVAVSNEYEVEAGGEKKVKSALVRVSDSGRGISQELSAHLFEQFTRDPSVRRKIQGTGLGLYIAKQIIAAHHGDIWAESEGENKGAAFFIRLPVS